MAQQVTLIIASVGVSIVGSGTLSHRMSCWACQVSARIKTSRCIQTSKFRAPFLFLDAQLERYSHDLFGHASRRQRAKADSSRAAKERLCSSSRNGRSQVATALTNETPQTQPPEARAYVQCWNAHEVS